MEIKQNILETIGNTPLIKLNRITAGIKATVLVKSEFFNPGGSIKDRIGLNMIEDAEKKGIIKPGDTIVEPTSGNTGTGLALAAVVKGYKIIFTIPDKMSKEKIELMRSYGAKVIVTPTAVAPDHPSNYVEVAKRIVKETPNAYMLNQFANPANPEIHYQTTGPEIWRQTDGKVDYLVATMGTGGTISGTARYLKEKNPKIKVIGVDPEGSIYHHKFTHTEGELHTYKVEGIGEDFLPTTLDFQVLDDIIVATDKDAFSTARRLLREEGIFAGGSAGMALFAALQVAKKLDVGKIIVVILPDTGRNYLNKFYSDDWMIQNNFIEGQKDEYIIGEILDLKSKNIQEIISVHPSDTLPTAFDLMKTYNISQLPVIKDDLIVGSLSEMNLMKNLLNREITSEQNVEDIMESPYMTIKKSDKISYPFALLKEKNAILVQENQKIVDIITTTDILTYLLKQKVE